MFEALRGRLRKWLSCGSRRGSNNDLRPYPPRRTRDRSVAEARRGNRSRVFRRQSRPDWARIESGRGNRCSRPFRLYRHARTNRPTHTRLLGRHIARHRRRGLLSPIGCHNCCRCRQRGPGELRRIPQALNRAQPTPYPRLSAYLLCRYLRLLATCDGGRERGNPSYGAVANANRDLIVGIKVRVGARASGRSGTVPLDIALQVADEVGMPVMAHIDDPPPTYEEVLARLRPGDILTHAFRPYPNAPVTAQGTVKQAVNEARRRGVLFDIGHGKGSFAFKTARAMLANGFFPDTISSDVHALCINGPAFDQVTTMSKFLCLGMPLANIIAASTTNAA